MDNLKKLDPPALLTLWNAGKVSFLEAVGYLLQKLVAFHEQQTQQRQQLVELRQAYLALNLTVNQLKADVDSLHANTTSNASPQS